MELHDFTLLLAGGILAMISSAFTTILAAFIAYRTARRSAVDDAIDRLNYLLGKNVAAAHDYRGPLEPFEQLKQQRQKFEALMKRAELSELRGTIGVLEELHDQHEKIEQRAYELDRSNANRRDSGGVA